jgi:hypothetical protein
MAILACVIVLASPAGVIQALVSSEESDDGLSARSRPAMRLQHSVLRPSGLDGPPENATPFRGAHVAPPRGAQRSRGARDQWCRELSAGDVKKFKGQVQERFRGDARLAHHHPEAGAPPGPQCAGQPRVEWVHERLRA